MKKDAPAFHSVDDYIDAWPAAVQKSLKQLRKTIRAAAPGVEEAISYQMPAYKYEGVLVYFAAYSGHIGFYPMPSAIQAFKKELKHITGTKGTVRFELDKPLPLELISRIVKFRVEENKKKTAVKNLKKNVKAVPKKK